MHEKKNPNRPLIVYYIIALVVVMLLNALLFPQIERYSVKQVDYSEFLSMLEDGKVKSVEIDDTQIAFTPVEQIQDGKATYYTTNRVTADDKLVERLLAAGVEFGQVVPEEMSPIISFLVTWVLPLVIFYGLGSFMFRKMSQRMGGNTMSFGKSNAKIYAETETGKTYVYPFIIGDSLLQTYMGPMVRADLLEKYNLPVPETIDEWENMLRVFKENGVKSPLTLRMDNVKFADMSTFISAYGAAGTFYVEDGKVKFGPYTEEYRQFLTLMSRWYSEGLLDPNFTDIDSKRLTSVIANGEAAAAFGSAGGDFGKWIPATQAQNPEARFIPVKYPVLNKGETPKFGQKSFPVSGFGAAISGKSKNIELAARFLDYGYSEEGHMTYNFGKEGESYTMVDGVPTYTDIILDNDKNGGLGVGPAMGKYIRACYNGPFVQDVNYLAQFYTMPEQLEGVKTWADTEALTYKMPPAPLTEEENKEYTKIMSNIDTYRQEVMYKTITGKSALSDLDAYFAEMKNRGIERAIELQQTAYDRYMAK